MTPRKAKKRRPVFLDPALAAKRAERAGPEPDEIEVSLFGPGYGECAVLHLGAGEWLIVDSCLDSGSGRPAALAYLSSIGIEPATAVKLVAVTHAHDDHIRGIAEVLLTCESATFVRPVATTKDEFLALLDADEDGEATSGSVAVYREFRGIEEILVSRQTRGAPYAVKHGFSDRPVFRRSGSESVPQVLVRALSPSDEALNRSLVALRSLLPSGGLVRRLTTDDPNTMCMALWVEIGDAHVLLGGDLENGPPPNCGWAGVEQNLEQPSGRASVYKVAHHGSPDAHSEYVWSTLLAENVVAILSPWRRGRTPLPSSEDRARLCNMTPRSYITADPDFRMSGGTARNRAAELSGAASDVRLSEGETGQIRLRRSVVDGSEWKVKLVKPAQKLEPAH
jgi:beta-lactamase superfamily II metal-dependent hydrolase